MEHYSLVPDTLKNIPNWVFWQIEPRDGKPTKVPYCAYHDEHASPDNPDTWAAFEDVCNRAPEYNFGIGFVFDGKGVVGIDLDKVLDDNHTILPEFSDITEKLASYTEITPSGTGLHIIIETDAEPFTRGRRSGQVEIYSTKRFFTVTGRRWNNTPTEIRKYTAEYVRKVLSPWIKIEDNTVVLETTTPSNLSDAEILSLLSHARNAQKFRSLYAGDKSAYHNDDSVADLALASFITFYTADACQIDRLMRGSALMRKKWSRSDYMKATIDKAIKGCSRRYEPENPEERINTARRLLEAAGVKL